MEKQIAQDIGDIIEFYSDKMRFEVFELLREKYNLPSKYWSLEMAEKMRENKPRFRPYDNSADL
jgi:hypothetical protein